MNKHVKKIGVVTVFAILAYSYMSAPRWYEAVGGVLFECTRDLCISEDTQTMYMSKRNKNTYTYHFNAGLKGRCSVEMSGSQVSTFALCDFDYSGTPLKEMLGYSDQLKTFLEIK